MPVVASNLFERLDFPTLGVGAKEDGKLIPISIHVWRNHTVELVMQRVQENLKLCGYNCTTTYSDYDDALVFANPREADLHVVWFDTNRHTDDNRGARFAEWFDARLASLRRQVNSPILVLRHADEEGNNGVAGVQFLNLTELNSLFSDELLDERWLSLSGSRINPHLYDEVATCVTLRGILNFFVNPVKLLVFDLDGTLYDGVLGEDGVLGLKFSQHHIQIQSLIKRLIERGVFVTLLSKNHAQDVTGIFREVSEWTIPREDLCSPQFSWEPKSSALETILQELNIGGESLVVFDDNPGEIADIRSKYEEAVTVVANEGGKRVRDAILLMPGLWLEPGMSGQLRNADIKASKLRREQESKADSRIEYLKSLQMKVRAWHCSVADIRRAAELSRKTNQFNLSLSRLSEVEIEQSLSKKDEYVILASLADRFSDSGTVLMLKASMKDSLLRIEELCISCRALGRDVESALVLSALSQIPGFEECVSIGVKFRLGARNEPAITWLGNLGVDLETPGYVTLTPDQFFARASLSQMVENEVADE